MQKRIAIVAATALAGVCRADVPLFTQEPFFFDVSTTFRGALCETDSQKIADDFVLTETSNITEFRWFNSYRRQSPNPWVPGDQVAFRINIYQVDAADEVSVTPAHSFDLLADVVRIDRMLQEANLYELSASIADLKLPAGRHVVSIQEADARTVPSEAIWPFAHHEADSVGWVFVGGNWDARTGNNESNMAFTVVGNVVPAPGVLVFAMPALAAAARRRR